MTYQSAQHVLQQLSTQAQTSEIRELAKAIGALTEELNRDMRDIKRCLQEIRSAQR